MNIEIRKLTPDLADDYACFFDATPHDDHTNKDELPCYCVTWRSDDAYPSNGYHWYPTREERRERAIQFIKDGKLQGYLAYHGERIVGWCNSTAECRHGVNYLRAYYPIEEYRTDVRVKSIFCFVIAPDMQRKGIAAQLVDRVCKDAADDGFDFVEAYVNKEFTDTAHEFMGPLAMYEKCGFTKSAEKEGRAVMRKALK
ncbi:MAG: GNAT family N-acetyltransferase [Oscillospiraceae bacterium]|nr:GNAT family N-acetyltransferase [Oscillospiraceae bacterium]